MTIGLVIGLWERGTTLIEVFAGHKPPDPPYVRLCRIENGKVAHIRDIDAELAAELAEVLDVLDGRTAELAKALRSAVKALDT